MSILNSLIELSKVDVALASLVAERKKIESELSQKLEKLKTNRVKKDGLEKVLADKQALASREDKSIKAERDRINERRRSMGTLGSYKLVQAAERELDYVGKQLSQREQLLLGLQSEVSTLNETLSALMQELEAAQADISMYETQAKETLSDIEEKTKEKTSLREGIVVTITPPQVLATYSRARDRFPSNPIVEVVNNQSCSGCFMKVGPQVFVQLSRGEVVKCPGCARILKLAEAAS